MAEERYSSDDLTQEFKLEVETELRFEIDGISKVTLELKNGLAEVFGTELVQNKKYVFPSNAKVAVFTWHGCTLELTGKTEIAYVAKETPMVIYVNVHAALESLRIKAEEKQSKGPNVLVAGPTDVGKSTLCRILLNYAVRQGRRPVFIDLDVGQGQISLPGTMGALIVERTADIEEGFPLQVPMVYHYGHNSPSNLNLYNALASRVAEVVNARAESNRRARASGSIINTCGWVKGNGYRSITHAALAFEVDVVLVIDHERLYNELVRDMPRFVQVVLIPKSGGVVERSKSVRAEARDSRVREYFYGLKKPLYPHSFDVKFSEIKVYKIGGRSLPDSCMPIGTKADDNHTKLVPVQIGPNLLHHILSVSFASSIEEDIVQSHVAGFICVTDIDIERQLLTVLSPHQRPLPKGVLLFSDVQFMAVH